MLNFAKLTVVLAAFAIFVPAHASQFPPEIYRARTVYLSCWTSILNECKYPRVLEGIQQQIASGNRWTVVAEPVKADLILVFFDDEDSSQTALGRVTIYNFRRFAGLVVLKGGATPDWNAIPLYVTGGSGAFTVVKEFYDQVIRTAPLLVPLSALMSTPNNTHHVVRWGRSVEEYTQILADEPGNSTAYYARGAAYYDKGEYDNAIKDFNMALSLKPDFDEARTRLEAAKKMKAAVDCHFQIPCPK